MRNSDYILSLDGAYSILDDMIYSCIVSKYPIREYKFDEDSDDSYVSPVVHGIAERTHLLYVCTIGTKSLCDNMKGDKVRNCDILWSGKHIAHEAQHLFRSMHTYQKPMSDDMLDMARMELLSAYFSGYKRNTYFYSPSEIDADRAGFLNCVKYFDENVFDDNGEQLFDAKSCLYERTKEHRYNRVWHIGANINCFDDMIKALDSMKYDYKIEPRHSVFGRGDECLAAQLLKYPVWKSVVESQDTIGTAYDEKLMAMSMDLDQLWIDRHKGMWAEAKRVQKLYPSQLPLSVRTGNKAVSFLNRMDEESQQLIAYGESLKEQLDERENENSIDSIDIWRP